MENNEQLLKYDENIGLYDHINPILNLKDLNRKQTKELAKEIANNESQTHSWQEVLNDAVNYDSKNKRQEKRFKRIFNKQLNENLAPILEKQHKQELIDRMKSGDASAMSQWTTEGINKFGHQFMPVILTAATLPFGIGAFGQAANTIGLLPALGAEAGSWGLGYGGYKLGSKLDDDFGTNWIAPALSAASGIGGYGAGYKGMVKLGSKGWLPKGDKFMYGSQFVGDVTADGINRNMYPITKFNKTVLQKRMDAYTSDSFVRDNLWFPQNIDEAKIRVEPEWNHVTSPQKDIFESPRTLIHWDGAATGNNSPKNVLTIGRPISKMTGVAHFENGKLVPAKTAIDVKKGPSFNSIDHPLMFSDYEPWFETPLTGRHLDWLDRFGDEKMWKWRLSEHGNELYTDYPHRIITIDSDTPGIKIQRGAHFGNRNSHEYYAGSIPISKIKEGFEWDPAIKTWGRVRYIDPSKTSSKGSYAFFERPSKLTLAERMGVPKGERNNGKILLSMQELVPSKFTSVPGFKPIGGKMIADKVANHPHILDRTRRLQRTYKRIVDPDYTLTNNWRKSRNTSPGMKIVDDIDVIHTNNPTGNTENIGGYYSPSEDVIYVRRRGTPDAQASTAFHEELHGYDFGQDEINDWVIKHLIDPEKVKEMSPQVQKYYLSSQEAPVHALQQGFIKGLDIGAPYPGDVAFDELLDSGIGGSLYYFKTQTPKDKRRLWRAMTGDLFIKKNGGKIK